MEDPQSQYADLSSKQSKINRCKPIWRTLLICNLAFGAYMFAAARKKNTNVPNDKTVKKDVEDRKTSEEDFLDSTLSVHETMFLPPAVLKAKEPIPEDQQLELFKWILKDKRKIKPKDPEEKKRIDEDKAILKQFVKAESIPKL